MPSSVPSFATFLITLALAAPPTLATPVAPAAMQAADAGTAASSPAAVRDVLQSIARKSTAQHSDALLVMHDGEVLLEDYGGQPPRTIELMSATKSVVALGIGALLADGHLASLDAPVSTWFPEWRQGRKAQITVRMLLDHTSGLQDIPNAGAEIYPAPDAVQLALAAELDAAPGERMRYSNKATNLLSGVIARASGRPMDMYLRDRLFVPLGIVPGMWYRDDTGNPHAMAGLPLTARDAARLGQLLLDDGVAPDGTRLLPEGFVEALFAPSARSEGVGLLWWRRPAWSEARLRGDAAAHLAAAGVSAEFIDALRPLAGRRFDSAIAALREALGEDFSERYGREINARGLGRGDVFEERSGPVVAYEANGYLGQYIVVVPGQRLVAVRQIRSREMDGTHPPDSEYGDFAGDIVALAQALSGDAGAARPD